MSTAADSDVVYLFCFANNDDDDDDEFYVLTHVECNC